MRYCAWPFPSLTCTTAGVWIHSDGLKRQWSSICLRSRSVLAEGQVTRYLVSFRKVLSSSGVRWAREDLPSRCDTTRKPRPEITCCWMDGDDSTSSQMKLISLELPTKKYCVE